jgi:hypothetical protein
MDDALSKFFISMKTLDLSIELSNIALEATGQQVSKNEILDMLRGILRQNTGLLGELQGSGWQQKSLGNDLQLSEYRFDYEQHSVEVQFANFLPRGDWQVQGIRLV